MKKLFLLATIALGVAVISCNKDQQAVKKLDGSWEEVSIDGTAVPDSSKGTLTFESCKLKNDTYCNATYTYSDGDKEDYTYKVSGKGTTLSMKYEDPNFGSFELISTIDELTKEKLVITTTFFDTWTTEYKKK
ncbi:MAG: lipocalin family protein [Crocinitomicaceae bacterium]